MSDPRNDWKRELQRTMACIPIERLGEELTASERQHLASCARCQAEMALFTEFRDGETTAAEADDVNAIVEALDVAPALSRRAQAESFRHENVISIASRRRLVQPRLLAAAAMILVAIGVGYIIQNREPSIEGPITRDVYRSQRIDVIAPLGDVATPPRELQWKSVDGADRYDVTVSEVDGTNLWRGSTRESPIALPDAIVRQIVPGKTIVWEVTAMRRGSALQSSASQRFRVITSPGSHP